MGKIELAKIGERSEQNSQLYFVPLEVLVMSNYPMTGIPTINGGIPFSCLFIKCS